MKYAERFQEAADAEEAFEAVVALLGSDMDDHDPIDGHVTVETLGSHLDSEQMSALNIADCHDDDIVIGYRTNDSFELITATLVEQ